MLQQDMGVDTRLWGYFCQISDPTTSYGSYSGAPPNERITWGTLGQDTPRFTIESDATIVAPLLFGYVLGKEARSAASKRAGPEPEFLAKARERGTGPLGLPGRAFVSSVIVRLLPP